VAEEPQTEEIEHGQHGKDPTEQPALRVARGLAGDSLRVAQMVPAAPEVLPTCALSAVLNVPGSTSGRHSRNKTLNASVTSTQSADELPAGQTEAEHQSPCRQFSALELTRERIPPAWLMTTSLTYYYIVNDYITTLAGFSRENCLSY